MLIGFGKVLASPLRVLPLSSTAPLTCACRIRALVCLLHVHSHTHFDILVCLDLPGFLCTNRPQASEQTSQRRPCRKVKRGRKGKHMNLTWCVRRPAGRKNRFFQLPPY